MNKELMDFVETKINSTSPMSIEEFIEEIKIIGLENLTLEEINEATIMVQKQSTKLTELRTFKRERE